MIKMYKELVSLLSTFLPKAAAQAIPLVALSLVAGWFGREIRDIVKSEAVKTQKIIDNNAAISDKLDYIINTNAIIIEYVNTLSVVTEKTNNTLSEMIREAAKEPVNVPLIDKLEKDVKSANAELPHYNIKRDTTKLVIRAVKKIP